MKTYKDWSPTSHDIKGLNLEDQQDWFVAPVLWTPKCNDPLQESNFRVILADLEKNCNSEDFQVHRFGHWASDFEIILVKPNTSAFTRSESWEEKLKDYPIADEDDFSLCEEEYNHF